MKNCITLALLALCIGFVASHEEESHSHDEDVHETLHLLEGIGAQLNSIDLLVNPDSGLHVHEEHAEGDHDHEDIEHEILHAVEDIEEHAWNIAIAFSDVLLDNHMRKKRHVDSEDGHEDILETTLSLLQSTEFALDVWTGVINGMHAEHHPDHEPLEQASCLELATAHEGDSIQEVQLHVLQAIGCHLENLEASFLHEHEEHHEEGGEEAEPAIIDCHAHEEDSHESSDSGVTESPDSGATESPVSGVTDANEGDHDEAGHESIHVLEEIECHLANIGGLLHLDHDHHHEDEEDH